jgi:anti-sigma regulatory factor (Ser/Thr protein kinase)
VETVLIDAWSLGDDAVPTLDEASVSVARERVRGEGARLGLPPDIIANLAIVVSELGHNQLVHGRGGLIVTRGVERDGVPGLEIVAADRGDGIANPSRAIGGDGSTAGGLGVGLGGVRRLTDEVDFDIRLGEGLCVWARKFAEPVRRRREVGTLGRYLHGERCSGDHAAFVRLKDALILAVADGLGHGQLAREASLSAIRCVTEGPERALDEMLVLCHAALQRTRGAVMSVTLIEEPSGEAALAAVGNVSTNVCGPGVFERHIGSSSALGMPGQLPRIRIERAHLRTWDALVQFTDGLSGRASLDGEASLLREHPIVIAQHLLEKFGGDQDDVLVQVAR